MMKKLALGLAVSLLIGCAANDSGSVTPIQQPLAVHQSPDTLNYYPLNIYDEGIKQVIQLTDQSAVLKFEGGESRVLGWKIPAYGVYRFKLASQVERTKFGREASAFMAEIRLLDKDFRVIKTLPAGKLGYQKPGMLEQEYVFHSFVVDNRDPLLPAIEYMMAVMADDGRDHEILVIDQEKEYAKVRGTLPPMTGDIMAVASEIGTITLEAMAVASSYVPGNAPAPAYMPPVDTGAQLAQTMNSGFDTVAISKMYREEVQKVLKAGDILTALEMRAHIHSLQETLQSDFAALYKTAGSRALVTQEALDEMGLNQKLAVTYQNQLLAYFKSGNTQQALGLLDQAKSLKGHVDELF